MRKTFTYYLYLKLLRVAGFIEKNFRILGISGPDVILCYHDVGESSWEYSTTRKNFDLHIKFLRDKFEIVTLDQLLKKTSNTKKPRMSITFDDGHKGVIVNALPVLKKYGLTATVFITGNSNLQIDGNKDFLSIREIKKLVNEGWEIGWHTQNHPDLTRISKNEKLYEINSSKINFEKNNGIKIKYFAYPFGKYDTRVIDKIDTVEFTHAFTVDGGKFQNDNRFLIPRNTVSRWMKYKDVENMCTQTGLLITKTFTRVWGYIDRFRQRERYDIILSTYDDINNPYYAGGGAISIHELARRLSKKYKVKVISSKYPNSKDGIIDSVIYEHIGISWMGPRFGQLIFQLFLVAKLMRQSFIVWIENFTPPFSTSFLPLFTKRTVVGLVHMLAAEDMRRKYYLPFDLVQNLGLKTYKHFIVVNEKDKSKIKKVNKKAEIVKIPNGIKMPNKTNKRKKADLLYLGRIEIDQKGLDLLIKAIKNIRDEKDVSLFIAGTGNSAELNKLHDLLLKENLNEKVKLLGRVGIKRKNELLIKSACLVVPSRYETFSMTALEGLSYGIPIVAYDIPGLNWIPDSYIYKTDSFDTTKFAANIVKAVNEKDVEIKRQRINYAKEFEWDNIQQKYEDYLSNFV